MRWDYTDPEKKTFVFNAGLLQSYFPEDNQLWRQKLAPEDYEGDIPAILTGKARLAERYNVEASPFPGAGPGSPQLKLTPKAEEDDSFILIEIDPATWMLRRAVLFDWAGNKTEFAFSRFKANPRLDARFFEIKVPPDCEIIDGRRRSPNLDSETARRGFQGGMPPWSQDGAQAPAEKGGRAAAFRGARWRGTARSPQETGSPPGRNKPFPPGFV